MELSTVSLILLVFVTQAIPIQAQTGACNSCRECSDDLNGLCKCDSNCVLFGDCCEHPQVDLSACRPLQPINTVPIDVELVCRSIYLDQRIEPLVDESFWMVSTCPSVWPTDVDSQRVRENCLSQAQSSSLPPVTDLSTGIVYTNEYCAFCNGVENLLAWQPSLACTPYVYAQLAALEYNVQELLRMDPTIFLTQCQACSYQAPIRNSISRPRSCFGAISTCSNRTQLETITGRQLSQESYNAMVSSCVNGPYDLVAASGSRYRNQDCALCNGDTSSVCFKNPGERKGVPFECAPVVPTTEPLTLASTNPIKGTVPPLLPFVPPGNRPLGKPFLPEGELATIAPELPVSSGIPFTITLSNLGGGQVQVSVRSETVTVMVDCPEGQAALGLECRPTLCPAGYVESGGRCAFQIGNIADSSADCVGGLVALNTSDYIVLDNDTLLYNDQVLSVMGFDLNGRPLVCIRNSVFFDCPSGLVALNASEFINLGNNTVMYGDDTFSVVEYDALNRPIICPPNATTITRNVTIYSYPEGYLILTYIGCSLSIIGSALVLLTYGIFKVLRTLPSLILMNVSAAILANNLFIIIGGPVTQAFPSTELCITVAICLHFFFLAQFSWMTIMSFQMARTFYQARKLNLDSKHQQKVTFGVYFVLGWSVPLAITVTSVILDYTTEHLILYGVLEDGRLGSCWINHFESAIVTFIVPLAVSLAFNFTLFVVVTTFICLAARASAKLNKNHNLHFFRVNTAIFSVTGLTWVFGFIALLAGTSWAWYPFIILNSTQGFVVFVAFLFTKRVLKLYWNFLLCRKPVDLSKGNKSTDSVSGTQQKTFTQSATKLSINV